MSDKQVQVFGTHDENTLAQARAVLDGGAVHMALMADGHLGYVMPVGGVAAYHNQVLIAGVGYDIACGNMAVKTDLVMSEVDYGSNLRHVADEINDRISFGVGRKNKSDSAPVDHPLFESEKWQAIPAHAREALKAKAREQLGTVGSGNHYVDVFADEDGWIWVGVHFGSRGLGHNIATGFMAMAEGLQWGAKVKEGDRLLDLDTPLGEDYWAAMELAGEYAYAGREWVCAEVLRILGAEEKMRVHNHHNFAWQESHHIVDEYMDLIVVRKGATPAFPGQMGFVGGSMGDNAVILRGARPYREERDYEYAQAVSATQSQMLYSTVHGAGRVMSRTRAAGKTKYRRVWACGSRDCDGYLNLSVLPGADGSNPKCPECGAKTHQRDIGETVRPGAIAQSEMDEWLSRTGVILRGAGLDEAPQAYRRLPDVLAAHAGTVEVLHTLQPLIVVMAGPDVRDPYKD